MNVVVAVCHHGYQKFDARMPKRVHESWSCEPSLTGSNQSGHSVFIAGETQVFTV